jgi:hypothetical protein
MSIKTIYICDKCGAEQFSEEQFWTVGLWAACSATRTTAYPNEYVADKRVHVCRPCLESFGIHVRVKDGVDPAPSPTIEELIREILEMAK